MRKIFKILMVLVLTVVIIGCGENSNETRRKEAAKKLQNVSNYLEETAENMDKFNKRNSTEDGLLDKNFNKSLEEYEKKREELKKKYHYE